MSGMQMQLYLTGEETKKKRDSSQGPWIEIKNPRHLGNALLTARKQAKMTQGEVAKTVDMDVTLLSNLELGQRIALSEKNFRKLEGVCKLLDVTPPPYIEMKHAPCSVNKKRRVNKSAPAKVERKVAEPSGHIVIPAAPAPVPEPALAPESHDSADHQKFKSALDLYNANLLTIGEFMNITRRIAK